jgi:hypothetical protein
MAGSRRRRSSAPEAPRVELLWWEECPSWERALADLRAAMDEVGLDPESVEVTEIPTEDDAERLSFIGSPTIRVDGEDIQPPGATEPVGLTCRIYRRPDGRVSPLPDPDEVRGALRKAIDEKETLS